MAGLRVGILGGTFDPVHVGHLKLAECAFEQLRLDRVLWLPAGAPWRKSDRRVTPAEHRMAMVRLAIEGNAAFELCSLEVERAGPSYSVNTVEELTRQHPDSELFFLVGLDALEDFPNWREPARVIELATVAVTPREGRRFGDEELDGLLPGLSGRVVWLEMSAIDVSATELRERAAAGASLRGQVPDAVATYIRRQGLYRRQE